MIGLKIDDHKPLINTQLTDKQNPAAACKDVKIKRMRKDGPVNPGQKKVEDCGCGSAVECWANKKGGARFHLQHCK